VQPTSAFEPPIGVGQLDPARAAEIDMRAISHDVAEYFLNAAGESEPDCVGIPGESERDSGIIANADPG
jgi:hypothetical protein